MYSLWKNIRYMLIKKQIAQHIQMCIATSRITKNTFKLKSGFGAFVFNNTYNKVSN